MERTEWVEHAEHMMQQMSETATKYTYSFSYWSVLIQRYNAEPKTIVITGNEAGKRRQELRNYFMPESYILTSEKEIFEVPILKDKNISDESLIFVCTHQACLAPVNTIGETLQIIAKK
jgi:uncharacterized protein YyaL (SSP411 family)